MKVDWSSYAAAYDEMAALNPAYQELLAAFRMATRDWTPRPGERMADLGAGTGNFSVELAQQFPECEVLHVDSDPAMNRVAEAKAESGRLRNLRVVASDLRSLDFPSGSLAALVSVHSLYTLPEPEQFLRRMHGWLRPGGVAFLCDFGRRMDVADWRRFLFRDCRRRFGLLPTLTRFYRGRVVAQANREIARRQDAGEFWTHDHDEFIAAVRRAGFEILNHSETYRGYSDLVVCHRHDGTPRLNQRAAAVFV